MPGKKMTSEVSIDNDLFNVTLGTLNKKKPETIYVELGTFLIPQKQEEDFEAIGNRLEIKFRKYLRETIEKENYFGKGYICAFSLPSNRMKKDKRSFLFIQCYLRPQVVKLIDTMTGDIENFVSKLSELFKRDLEEYNLSYSKTKKDKTIYKEIE